MPIRSIRIPLLLSVAILCVGSSVVADDTKPKRPATEVDVSFANGSVIRMVLADTPIDVQTDYGKLSIPIRDLKRIEFGVHLPPGLEKQLDQLVADLGSENFRVREAATTSLIRHGAMALPVLVEASRKDDAELSKRAKGVVAKLQQNLPGKEFRVETADTIVTPKFTFVGKILTTTMKAETEYFGPVTLDLVKLRTLRSTEVPAEMVVKVDAAKYASQSQQWLKTEYEISGQTKLAIAASGRIDLWPDQGGGEQYMCSPKGFPNAGPQFGAGGARERFVSGALVGKLGENGTPFLIGEAYEGSPGEGRLFLHIVPSPWGNESSGTFEVKISAR